MEQIRTQLEQELFKLSDEGWAHVLAEVGEQATAADIKRFVLEVDLKKIAEPSIPKDLKKLQNGEINERLVLQITSIVDVSAPKAKRERRGLDPHRPHLCVVNFSDGHTTLHGVEYQPISDLHALAAGAKVVLLRADMRGGYLLLHPHSFAAVLFRGHHDAHLTMRKQGHVTGTQGPPPFTALPLESRATESRATDQGRDQRNNPTNPDKKGNNTQRQKNDNAGQDTAKNSNPKNSNNNPRHTKNNSVNKNSGNASATSADQSAHRTDHRGEARPNARANNSTTGANNSSTDAQTRSSNDRGNTLHSTDNRGNNRDPTRGASNRGNDNPQRNNTHRGNKSDTRGTTNVHNSTDSRGSTDSGNTNGSRGNDRANYSRNNADNNRANNSRNNNDSRANSRNNNGNNARRNNADPNSATAPNERKQDETRPRYEAKNRPNNPKNSAQAAYHPKTDRARTDTPVQSARTPHNATTHRGTNARHEGPAQRASGAKYAAKPAPPPSASESTYYQAITPLLQALVSFRPPQASEAFLSVQVTLTRVTLGSVTFLTDHLVCLALSDALTVLQVCCDLALLADLLHVPADNAPLVLQTAYQVLGAAQPVYHLVAPVQLNEPVNMIAGYIMLTDVEL